MNWTDLLHYNNNNNNNNQEAVHTDREVTANRPDIIIKNMAWEEDAWTIAT